MSSARATLLIGNLRAQAPPCASLHWHVAACESGDGLHRVEVMHAMCRLYTDHMYYPGIVVLKLAVMSGGCGHVDSCERVQCDLCQVRASETIWAWRCSALADETILPA